jgi:hypothetical protein
LGLSSGLNIVNGPANFFRGDGLDLAEPVGQVDDSASPGACAAPSRSSVMALSIGIRSRSILNGTHTVPLQHSQPIQG